MVPYEILIYIKNHYISILLAIEYICLSVIRITLETCYSQLFIEIQELTQCYLNNFTTPLEELCWRIV